ncbi:MAG: GNAT family N-acetyltransferase [Thermomicrobiales bacterium]
MAGNSHHHASSPLSMPDVAKAIQQPTRGQDIQIRPVEGNEFGACQRLAGEVFAFTDLEVIPAWQMYTTAHHGGLTLGAYANNDLIGYSHAFPAYDGRDVYLYSCGLAVKPASRFRGVGRSLKLAQRTLARRAGYRLIRWTVDALASGPLYLYLTRLGGRVVGYEPRLYSEFRSEQAVDEVVVDWNLDDDIDDANLDRQATVRSYRAYMRSVEIPWDRRILAASEARQWERQVAERIPALLADGFQGMAVERDGAARRSYVWFGRP